jgi:cytochrome c biogenesis protein CcdA
MFLAFLAGTLSILSPCVLPLLPLTLGAAAAQGRYGPLALACGLTLSFVTVGLFVALVGFSIGLDQGVFRAFGATVLIAIGIVLISPILQQQVALVAGPASNRLSGKLSSYTGAGYGGQFLLGVVLGIVWTPCVGPTLGAASILAARGDNLASVVLIMTAFGIGAALPLLILGSLSREFYQRWRGRMIGSGTVLKPVLGVILAVTGLMILTGFDKRAEARLVELSPAWLTELTTRY